MRGHASRSTPAPWTVLWTAPVASDANITPSFGPEIDLGERYPPNARIHGASRLPCVGNPTRVPTGRMKASDLDCYRVIFGGTACDGALSIFCVREGPEPASDPLIVDPA